ncbi:MAG TPA: 5-(carboxyamino)imidazole ribonucleotide synthase [Polyangiaceae bacterium]|nr:5-(carboxyamino)imidazole ribonucleotide synthase [Polyangiaceae bacterium]
MRLGIIGGGQLGRMLALAAQPMGIRVSVVDPTADTPAAVVAEHLQADFSDETALAQLAARSDVVTFEFENVPDSAARLLQDARPVFPPPEALRVAQERWVEKSAFVELGIDTPRFFRVDNEAELRHAFAQLGQLVLKTRRGGYDGKGQAVIRDTAALERAIVEFAGIPCIAEELVSFQRELSVVVCRGRDGSTVVYPLAENRHRGGILRESIAPAPDVSPALAAQAEEWGRRLTAHFGYVGVLALELFQVGDRLLANEFAPRVHNSGHWTIEGARTSQFENHVRAVCGLPLGDASALCPTAMLNCIGRMPDAAAVLAITDTHVHDYGKEPRAERKVGHVTVRAPSHAELNERIAALLALWPADG